MSRAKWLLVVAVIAVAGVSAERFWRRMQGQQRQRQLEVAEAQLAQGRALDALANVEAVLRSDPHSAQAHWLAGLACAPLGRSGEALDHWEQITPAAPRLYFESRRSGASLALKSGDWTRAERFLRDGLTCGLETDRFRHQLVQLLGWCGRGWEAIEHLQLLLANGQLSLELLCALGDPYRPFQAGSVLQDIGPGAPDDALRRLASACVALEHGKLEQAEHELQLSLSAGPGLVEAYIRWAQLPGRQRSEAELTRGEQQLPKDASTHPGLWVVRGDRARRTGQLAVAAECYLRAMALDLNHLEACSRGAAVVQELGHAAEAAWCADRSEQLEALRRRLEAIRNLPSRRSGEAWELLQDLSDRTLRLGRNLEARGWAEWAQQLDPSADWPRARVAELSPDGGPTAPLDRTPPLPSSLARLLGATPLPDFCQPLHAPASSPSERPPNSDDHAIALVDVAPAAGLNFHFENAGHLGRNKRVHTFTGGGVGVLDYDQDGWPDCLLTQGHAEPLPMTPQNRFNDALFRNRGGVAFEEVASYAGIVDFGYSQGCAVGDLNSDGFPELYVGNIGPNSLWWNNGDGTFSPDSNPLFAGDPAWTSSPVIVDLNADGHPDIYDVNYLAAPDLFERICGTSEHLHICNPVTFDGAPNRALLNSGAGEFREQTAALGLDSPDGRGLGVVAGRLDDDRALDAYVANDMAANRLYLGTINSGDGPPGVYRETGILSGVAFDLRGRSQAGMGIAAGDVDGNGRLDLFVTNFLFENNALYLQQGSASFEESSDAAGLATASVNLLGFGCQFLDVDFDGDLDLFVTNGHIDDFRDLGAPYRMPSQLFLNDGAGRFHLSRETPVDADGRTDWLGRAVATLDWDRNGATDILVSRVTQPVVLLQGPSVPAGRHALSLRFLGAEARDAIGTVVRLRTGDRWQVRQVLAGGGYEAANELQLSFGLGASAVADELVVEWPSGRQERWLQVPGDRPLLIVEGAGTYPLAANTHHR